MGRIRGRNTAPELVVRRLVSGLGYRYRLHVTKLPGKPDIVFSGRRKVIFVHGCFWHGHDGCTRAQRPTSNVEFWRKKLDANRGRDAKQLRALKEAGWEPLVV